MTQSEAIQAVQSVYAEVEAINLPRACTARTTCCQFRLTGKTPMLTAGEALVAAQGARAAGRKTLPDSTDPQSGRCPLIGRDGGCTIYQHRPFGCRTHFCEAAGGMYPRKSVQHLIHQLEAIGEAVGDTDVRPLPEAVDAAMQSLAKNGKGGKKKPTQGSTRRKRGHPKSGGRG